MKQIIKLKGVWDRWNWGKGIVLVYSLFVLGILFLVYQSKQQKLDLVYDDYYAQELMFQNQIDATQRVEDAGEKPSLVRKNGDVFLLIPSSKGIPVSGSLSAYCASDKSKDQLMRLSQTTTGLWRLPVLGLKSGRYTFKIKWKQLGESYYSELPFEK
jgi:hypothetical protein